MMLSRSWPSSRASTWVSRTSATTSPRPRRHSSSRTSASTWWVGRSNESRWAI